MFRKTIIALAATSLIAAASITPASAHGWGPGWGWGWGAAAVGLAVGATIAATAYQPPVNCWQYRLVPTPYGYYKRVLVNVC
jgi:hypothetical protein